MNKLFNFLSSLVFAAPVASAGRAIPIVILGRKSKNGSNYRTSLSIPAQVKMCKAVLAQKGASSGQKYRVIKVIESNESGVTADRPCLMKAAALAQKAGGYVSDINLI